MARGKGQRANANQLYIGWGLMHNPRSYVLERRKKGRKLKDFKN